MATIQKRRLAGGIQHTIVWHVNGKRKRKSLGFITDIEAKKALLEHELDLLNKVPESIEVPLFVDYAEQYKHKHEQDYPRSHRRIQGIIDQHLVPYFKDFKLDEIEVRDVKNYQRLRKSMRRYPNNLKNLGLYKSATINKELVTLKAILNEAVESKIIMRHQIKKAGKLRILDSKPISYFMLDELELLYDVSHARHHWWRLLANTGLRLGEARNLTWTNVKKDFIHIVSSEERSTKSGNWRKVPIGPNVRKALLEFWRIESGNKNAISYPRIGSYIFPSLSAGAISKAAKFDITAAGLEGSAHVFRHTFISLLAIEGTPIQTLKDLAGHSDIAITLGYMHLAPDYLSGVAKHC